MLMEMDARRVTLTILFVIWLSIQTLVIGLSPSWGFVLPHEHITRGTLSAAAWEEHMREHLLGSRPLQQAHLDVPQSMEAGTVIASIPDSAGAVSTWSMFAAHMHDANVEIPKFDAPRVAWTTPTFVAFELAFTPLKPPPNI